MKRQQAVSTITIEYKDDETAKQRLIDFIIEFLLDAEEEEEK